MYHLNEEQRSAITTYLMNWASLMAASVTFIETADILLKCISVTIAIVVLYFTRKRLKRDLIMRDIDIEVKRLQKQQEEQKLHILLEQSKQLSGTNGKEERHAEPNEN